MKKIIQNEIQGEFKKQARRDLGNFLLLTMIIE